MVTVAEAENYASMVRLTNPFYHPNIQQLIESPPVDLLRWTGRSPEEQARMITNQTTSQREKSQALTSLYPTDYKVYPSEMPQATASSGVIAELQKRVGDKTLSIQERNQAQSALSKYGKVITITPSQPVQSSAFIEGMKQAQKSELPIAPPSRLSRAYTEAEELVSKYTTKPIFGAIQKVTGFDLTNATQMSVFTPSLIGIGSIGIKPVPEQDLMAGVSAGIMKDIRDEPIKQFALIGLGGSLGFGFKGISTGLSAIPDIGGVALGEMASTGFKIGAISAGVYQTAGAIGSTATAVSQAKNLQEAGGIIGVSAKDLALIGYGFQQGEKLFDIAKGEYRTLGLKELELPKGEYPQAPTNKQLELFQKNVYKEISEKPVAFHTTGEVFYKEGIITPKAGTSELSGLYGSTQVSTPFARIPGSSPELATNLKAFQQAVINLFATEKSPGIASLEPKGFREVKFGFSDIPQFEGQKYVKGKGYAYFKEPAIKGYMDLPLMKTEIESIARVESGDYGATGKRFYTKIEGVKVPIDAFKYMESQLKDNLDIMNKNIKGSLEKGTNFKPEKYSSYKEPSISSAIPFSGGYSSISKSIQSSITSMQSSLKSSMKSDISSLSSSISRGSSNLSSDASNISSGISSDISDISSLISGKSSGVSKKSSTKSGISRGYSGKSSILSSETIKEITSIPITSGKSLERKSLGKGYNVYGKQLKSNKFFQINHSPLTKSRAEDIGAYYVSQTLARTFQVRSAGKQAQEDYEFMSVPEGYFKSREYQLREHRIKKGRIVETPEQFIQKSVYALSSQAERKQIQNFRKEVQRLTR